MTQLTDQNGGVWEISQTAVERLLAAKTARQANDVFDGFASHVPDASRLAIWQAVDAD